MLVVTVKDRQLVELSDNGKTLGTIEVSLRRDGSVRMALDFPRDIRIMRKEIVNRISKEESDG
jgi:sRNA-binding carbon storage regulator CsrA